VPAGSWEIPQPLERPLEHQLRLAGTQAHRIYRQVTVFGVIAVGRTQLNQLDATSNSLLDTAQQRRGLQLARGDQVLGGQACRGDNRRIRRRKFIVDQVPRCHPRQRLPFSAMGLAGKSRDFPDIQQYLLVRIVMLHLDQRPRRGDLDAQLFLQFTGQSRGNRLISLHLAAGKLPEPALMLSIGTARQQDPAIDTADHRCCYMHSFHATASSRRSPL